MKYDVIYFSKLNSQRYDFSINKKFVNQSINLFILLPQFICYCTLRISKWLETGVDNETNLSKIEITCNARVLLRNSSEKKASPKKYRYFGPSFYSYYGKPANVGSWRINGFSRQKENNFHNSIYIYRAFHFLQARGTYVLSI